MLITVNQHRLTRFALCALLAALCPIGFAQTIAELKSLQELSQPDQVRRSSLTPEQKAKLRSAVQKALQKDYEFPNDFPKVFMDFRLKQVHWAPDQPDGFVVQGSGSDLCGATGNCPFFLFDANFNLLLRVPVVQRFALLPASPGRPVEVLAATHESSFDRIVRRFKFAGYSYVPSVCSEVDYQDPTTFEERKRPTIKRISCSVRP